MTDRFVINLLHGGGILNSKNPHPKNHAHVGRTWRQFTLRRNCGVIIRADRGPREPPFTRHILLLLRVVQRPCFIPISNAAPAILLIETAPVNVPNPKPDLNVTVMVQDPPRFMVCRATSYSVWLPQHRDNPKTIASAMDPTVDLEDSRREKLRRNFGWPRWFYPVPCHQFGWRLWQSRRHQMALRARRHGSSQRSVGPVRLGKVDWRLCRQL